MTVNEILDELENLVVDAKHLLFTNKSIIEETDLVRLVEDLRNELPLELERAAKIMEEKKDILDAANAEAAKIVEQSKAYALKLTDESAVALQAQEKAKTIMEQTQAQEKEIMEKTMQNSQQLRDDADQYANQVFDHLITNVGNALQVVQQAKEELNQDKEEK
jgi:hypothetical protein